VVIPEVVRMVVEAAVAMGASKVSMMPTGLSREALRLEDPNTRRARAPVACPVRHYLLELRFRWDRIPTAAPRSSPAMVRRMSGRTSRHL